MSKIETFAKESQQARYNRIDDYKRLLNERAKDLDLNLRPGNLEYKSCAELWEEGRPSSLGKDDLSRMEPHGFLVVEVPTNDDLRFGRAPTPCLLMFSRQDLVRIALSILDGEEHSFATTEDLILEELREINRKIGFEDAEES